MKGCLNVLPPSVHNFIKRIQIWVNGTYTYGLIDDPKVLKHTTAHHHRQWLDSVNDIPQKALGVEIYNCAEYECMRLHWNGCGLLLHEFCHLIHQVILKDGLQNEMIMGVFGEALEGGLYDDVMRRDWAFSSGDRDAAYATINHKEFFSELSVAYLSRGYDKHVSSSQSKMNIKMADCTPPIMAFDVIQRMEEQETQQGQDSISKECVETYVEHQQNWMDKLKQAIGKSGKGHCNKFFPFTHQQLREFDPLTYAVFSQAWKTISNSDDPIEVQRGHNVMKCDGCMNIPIQSHLVGFLNRRGGANSTAKKSHFIASNLDETVDSGSDRDQDELVVY